MLHPTIEDHRGWSAVHGKPRNKLNHSNPIGQGRTGTLGSRLSEGKGRQTVRLMTLRKDGKVAEKGKVQPPAPITKRERLMLGSDSAETWATKNAAPDNERTKVQWHFRGVDYDSFESMQAAIEAGAK